MFDNSLTDRINSLYCDSYYPTALVSILIGYASRVLRCSLGKVEVKSPLKHWEEILVQWVCLNRGIFEYTKGKFAAYSYRERPNIGVMAGAAIRAGWIALEECWSEKEGTLGLKNGRGDLWLWRDIHHERIEAKFTTDGFSELKNKIRSRYESAKADARRLGNLADARNTALTFIAPRGKR